MEEVRICFKSKTSRAGVILAQRILEEAEYDSKHSYKILEIISQHDTRQGFLNANDGVVRDSDKLYRYTIPNFRVWVKERKKTLEQTRQFFLDEMSQEGIFYSGVSKQIAKIELENTVKFMNKT